MHRLGGRAGRGEEGGGTNEGCCSSLRRVGDKTKEGLAVRYYVYTATKRLHTLRKHGDILARRVRYVFPGGSAW